MNDRYQWHEHTLTEWEIRSLDFTIEMWRGLLPIERLEMHIAQLKTNINTAVDGLHVLLKALPYPPHTVQLTSQNIPDDCKPPNEAGLPLVDVDEHPEYVEYMEAINGHAALTASLKALNKKLLRLNEDITKKQSKRKSHTGGDTR